MVPCDRCIAHWQPGRGCRTLFSMSQFRRICALVTFQGKSEEAQRVQMQALHIYEKALGREHASVAMACSVLALCMQDQVTQDDSRSKRVSSR